MKAMVIFDSVFGNTEQVAQAISTAIGKKEEVVLVRVRDVSLVLLKELDYLVVGSPTRGFRPTEDVSKFLKDIPLNGLKGVKAVAFDTRIPLETIKSKFFRKVVEKGGYAGPAISKRLKAKGAEILSHPEGFFVQDTEGPLVEGELERAREWIKSLK